MRQLLVDTRDQIVDVLTDAQKAEFQEKLKAAQSAGAGSGPAAMVQRIETALEKLDLSEDQKSQIKETFAHVKSEVQDLQKQVQAGTLDRAAAQEKIRPLMEDMRTKFQAILTPKQAQTLRDAIQAGRPTSRPAA